MGRRHLSRLLPFVIALAVAAPSAAAGAVPFRIVAQGISTGATTAKPFALLATSRIGAHRIVLDLRPSAAQPVLRANFRTSVVVGVFGPFGCRDGRVRVTRITETGRMLTVHLTMKPPAPGTAECLAIYQTARVLVLPRGSLDPVPTMVTVTVAGS